MDLGKEASISSHLMLSPLIAWEGGALCDTLSLLGHFILPGVILIPMGRLYISEKVFGVLLFVLLV